METCNRPAYGSCVDVKLAGLIRGRGDAALAIALVAIAITQNWLSDMSTAEKLGTSAALIVLGVLAALRARMPVLFLAALVGLIIVGSLLQKPLDDIESVGFFALLAVYTGGVHTSGRRTVAAGVLTFALFLSVLIGDPEEINISGTIFFALVFAGPWVVGRTIRRRRLRERQLEQEKADAEEAIVEERARIARELHDVVAHAISVIVLQARGGRKLIDSEPGETRAALDAIERTASQALAEMRRMLELLREGDEQLALAPQPSLSQLDLLAERVRAAGLPVDVEVRGKPVALPPGVDLSAYRIVQEALTNALKHAGPAKTRVIVNYEPGELILEIVDDGTGDSNGAGAGHGLAGIRERVSLYGGDVEAGTRADGGYAVRARMPYATER
jgi:signal transduction histidine kinase